MTPVISPWVFYWMSVTDIVKGIAFVFVLIFGIWLFLELIDNGMKGPAPLLAAALSVSVALATFVPSAGTITKMLVAQNVTYERVEVAADTVQNVYEDIMSLFEGGDKK